jgi:hypothetical protein
MPMADLLAFAGRPGRAAELDIVAYEAFFGFI